MRHFILSIITVSFLFSCNKVKVPQDENTGIIEPLYRCEEDGFAGEYPCKDYDLLSFIKLEDLNGLGTVGNDCWGWVDPTTQKEYALMGTNKGVTFIDITDPLTPIVLGNVPTATSSSTWRDVKVYKNHAFIVSEANNHGIQVFDLTRLRSVVNAPQDFTPDAHYTGIGSAHNIVINEDSGYIYPVGTSRSGTYAGGPIFLNAQNPLNLVEEGGYPGYSHDSHVVTYDGPDSEYTGKEILIGSNENEVIIVDVTDKSNPQKISSISYSNVGYTHQGWFTLDKRYFILGDELDEINFGGKTRTIVFDFQDLDNPSFKMDYLGSTEAIDHNGYVKGTTYFQANYTAGVRMIDVSDIDNNSIKEVGFFDTFPSGNSASFNGAWSVYPYFPSGNIIISDINKGLFIIRKSGT